VQIPSEGDAVPTAMAEANARPAPALDEETLRNIDQVRDLRQHIRSRLGLPLE
jgi:hypothetical protein